MRFVLLLAISCFITGGASAGRNDDASLRAAAQSLDRALEQKDTALLNQLLSAKLRYGHSNGWIETREELKANLYNGKLVYRSIKDNGMGLQTVIDGNTGLVREDVAIDVVLDNKPVSLNLSVLQVWVFDKGGWRLIGRHSTKVEKH
jgi:hypothetical protein